MAAHGVAGVPEGVGPASSLGQAGGTPGGPRGVLRPGADVPVFEARGGGPLGQDVRGVVRPAEDGHAAQGLLEAGEFGGIGGQGATEEGPLGEEEVHHAGGVGELLGGVLNLLVSLQRFNVEGGEAGDVQAGLVEGLAGGPGLLLTGKDGVEAQLGARGEGHGEGPGLAVEDEGFAHRFLAPDLAGDADDLVGGGGKGGVGGEEVLVGPFLDGVVLGGGGPAKGVDPAVARAHEEASVGGDDLVGPLGQFVGPEFLAGVRVAGEEFPARALFRIALEGRAEDGAAGVDDGAHVGVVAGDGSPHDGDAHHGVEVAVVALGLDVPETLELVVLLLGFLVDDDLDGVGLVAAVAAPAVHGAHEGIERFPVAGRVVRVGAGPGVVGAVRALVAVEEGPVELLEVHGHVEVALGEVDVTDGGEAPAVEGLAVGAVAPEAFAGLGIEGAHEGAVMREDAHPEVGHSLVDHDVGAHRPGRGELAEGKHPAFGGGGLVLPDERAGVGGEAVDVAVVASDVDPALGDGGAAVDGGASHEFPAGLAGGGLEAAEAPFRHAGEEEEFARGGEGKAVLVELGGDLEVELALLERGAV